MNEIINIRPERATTPFCSLRFSLFFRRLLSRLGVYMNIIMPISSIGMKRIPIINQPCDQCRVPAGRNINAPKSTMPAMYLVRTVISSFICFIFLLCKDSYFCLNVWLYFRFFCVILCSLYVLSSIYNLYSSSIAVAK